MSVEEAWKDFAALAREHSDALIDQTVASVVQSPSSAYNTLPLEHFRAVARGAIHAIIADIDAEVPHHYGDLFVSGTELRVRQGFKMQDMQSALDFMERLFRDFFFEQLEDPEKRLQAIERCHFILASTRNVMFGAFVNTSETMLREQLDIVKQLSTPIMPIYGGVLVLPLIGPIDARRGEQIMESLLSATAQEQASVVIIDITGVPALDAGVASCLSKVAQAARLLGAEVVIVGIGPRIAQTMAAEAIDLGGAATLANLEAGLEYALSLRRLFIQERRAQ
jgi:rsbT co-antagonist protein RsbR